MRITTAIFVCALLTGCSTVLEKWPDISSIPDQPEPPPVVVVPDVPPAVEPTRQWPENGSQVLYGKRNSDNTGNLVVLLPSKWSNIFVDVWIIDKNGKRHNDSGRRNINLGDNNNGFRRHCWFGVPGQDIGKGTLVVVLTTGEKRIPMDFAKEKVKINQ